ncbi:lytic murein transglycosylase [Woodsholea maritima]|uniref:lytic murein transglycosylase n=1 Tax=Woodsholea maritima TaxID=240237 RepID=UPI000379D492|nr:lytic murein transglycosylase [Woodsholea maritima]
MTAKHQTLRALMVALALGSALTAPVMAQDQPFETWSRDFQARLIDRGVDRAIVASMFDGIEPDPRIIERDRSQPEFVRPIWEYIAGAASEDRAAKGRLAQIREIEALNAIEARYEVDRHILTAIWGLESAYGEIQGTNDIVRALATLAWEGRRRQWAEDQLYAVTRMLDRGWATRDQLKGSWAGAMGQTQFIPTTYLERAQDLDNDGDRDIWGDAGDALASAAALLNRGGWQANAPVVIEVTLGEDFNWSVWNETGWKPVSEWAALGVARQGSLPWDEYLLNRRAKLNAPAGARGPAFLTFDNFEAIKHYNNSTAYALGVAYLASKLGSGPDIVGEWPLDNPPLNRAQSQAMQEALVDLGYDPGGVDGIVGPNTRRAIRAFQAAEGMTPDGYAGAEVHGRILRKAGRT